jgi:hypothetical protein
MCGADLSDLEEENPLDREDNLDKKSGLDKGKDKP